MKKPKKTFLCYDDHPDRDKITKLIEAELEKCTNKIKQIEKKYKNTGIGDTCMDETISEVFYEKLHYQ